MRAAWSEGVTPSFLPGEGGSGGDSSKIISVDFVLAK